jgi:hypothetical protein
MTVPVASPNLTEDDRMRKLAWALAVVVTAAALTRATAGDKGTTVELGKHKSTTPPGWKQQELDPKLGKFRIYQFALPKADGDKEDAELLVFYFSGGGGSNADNIKRWKGMFGAPKDKTIDEVTKVSEFKVGDVPVTYVEIMGTYLYKFPPFAPNAKVTPKENFRFIGVVFDSQDGPYYLRLTGPARTVEQQKDAFDKWLKGFK